jgi:hypothetical protein
MRVTGRALIGRARAGPSQRGPVFAPLWQRFVVVNMSLVGLVAGSVFGAAAIVPFFVSFLRASRKRTPNSSSRRR